MPEVTHCIYCTATDHIIDVIPAGGDGITAAKHIDKLAPKYGSNLIVLTIEEANRRYEAQFISPSVEIDERRWMDMLEVLPPQGWKHDASGESFKLQEMTAGCITAIFVRIGERYFELSDSMFTKHADCISRVLANFPDARPK